MIYINFVELHCLMLHAKFQNHRPSSSGGEDSYMFFAIYSHGSHLGHVTWTIYINFFFLLLRMLHMKIGFDWPSSFRGEDHDGRCFNIMVIYMYIAPGQGQTTPRGQNFSININFLSICLFPVSFTHLIAFYHFFPFKCIGDLS